MLETLANLDSGMLLFIQDYIRNSILTPIFLIVTKLGNAGIIWIILSIVLLIPKKTRTIGYMSVCALIGSLLINNLILKNLVERTRPYEVVQGLVPLLGKQADFSFPSGHTGSSFAAAGILYRKLPKKYGIPAMVLAFLIAMSRLYLGVHYPSDVLFGMLSGIAISYVAEKIVNYRYRENLEMESIDV